MEGRVFMSERKKHTNRLLVFMGLLFLLSFLPWNTLNAKAAVTLSHKKMILTVNQKQYLRVKGRPAGSTLIWRSSNTSVATVAGGTVRARRRGNAVISVTVMRNRRRVAVRTCRVRVAEVPTVVASLGVTGEASEYIAGITFLVDGKRSMLLTNKLVLQTPGQRWQTLYLLDENQISSSRGNKISWLRGKTISPYNNNDRNIETAYFARKDFRPFRITSASGSVFYFYYDGIKYKAAARDLGSSLDPQPCRLVRLTPVSPA